MSSQTNKQQTNTVLLTLSHFILLLITLPILITLRVPPHGLKHHDNKDTSGPPAILYLTVLDLQLKRKRPSQPNGTASPAGELEKEEDQHAGPELQRTGR